MEKIKLIDEKYDWRLPNLFELYDLADRNQKKPAINSIFNKVEQSSYWSSSTEQYWKKRSYSVDFDYGNDSQHESSTELYVRCIRNITK